jgi:hypothetical protein
MGIADSRVNQDWAISILWRPFDGLNIKHILIAAPSAFSRFFCLRFSKCAGGGSPCIRLRALSFNSFNSCLLLLGQFRRQGYSCNIKPSVKEILDAFAIKC